MMRPLLLNTYDAHGGAAIAALRLHQALRDIGTDSRLLVELVTRETPDILGPRGFIGRAAARMRMMLEERIVRYHSSTARDFSPNLIPSCTVRQVRSVAPDLVHLHWISHGLLRIEDMPRLGVPLVWTLHDTWAFTGGCHYPMECEGYRDRCGSCPALGSTRERDLSRAIWERKRKYWGGLPIQVVTPSRWLAERARASSLFAGRDVEVIPNTLDTELFKPNDRAAMRRLFNLPPSADLVLFGAVDSMSNARKGAEFLLPALQHLKETVPAGVELVVLGASRPPDGGSFPFPTHFMGSLQDPAALAALYSAVNVAVIPSVQDNLPNVALESLSCGVPCVAFDVGGLSDLVRPGETGYLARPYSPVDLAQGIAACLEPTQAAVLAAGARAHVMQNFAPSIIAQRHLALYQKVLERSAKPAF